jgi:hypothetical protein
LWSFTDFFLELMNQQPPFAIEDLPAFLTGVGEAA